MYRKDLQSKMKKAVAVVTCFAMMFGVAACGKNDSDRNDRDDNNTRTEEASEDSKETNADVEPGKEDGEEDPEVMAAFDEYLFDYFEDYVTSDTLTYNYSLKDGSIFGFEEPEEVSLGDPDMSEEAIAKDKEEFDETFSELKAIDRASLSDEQQLTYDILYEYLETAEMEYDNIYLYDPFAPMRGLQANLATNFTDYRFDDKGDVERYIEMITQVDEYFEGCLEFEKDKSEKGFFMSDAVCDDVIEQCETFIENTDDHFMITVFNNNIDELDFLTDEEKEDFKAQNEVAVRENLFPAYENTIEVLTSLKGTGTNDKGLCYYDGGKEYYSYLLRRYAGTSKTPEEVIDMLDSNMEDLMMELYSVYFYDPEGYEYVVENFDTLFSETDNMTASEMIDTLMETATENYPEIGDIPYKADALDENLETIMDNTLAYYMSPAYDDPENNLIRVNGLHTDGLWTTLAHEGYPGHMLQNAYFMSTNPNPVRTIYNFLGYMEGWAMYACYDSLNYYEYEDPSYAKTIATVYRINDEIGYLVMGRIDLGINYEGWTLEETADYLDENGFDGSAAESIYYTMVGDPAVYQSYSTGYYELKELHDYAERKLGKKFDVKEFNTVVLTTGPCQFDILKEQIDKYIEEVK